MALHFSKGPKPWDSTRSGFTSTGLLGEMQQRVYRFQQRDDRGTGPETIYKQLLASKKVPSHAEHAERKRLERPVNPTMAERIQQQYNRRGMGRR